MVFSSWSFLGVFLPLVLLVYHGTFRLTTGSQKQGILLCASWIFYGLWDWRYWPLLLLTTLSSYVLGVLIYRSRAKGLVALSLTLNLAPLVYFKYAGWLSGDGALTSLILPLGISFFTFQQMTFTVDAFRRRIRPDGFLNYATYIAFFPQLIAGPIVHFNELAPQLQRLPKPTPEQLRRALLLIAMGLFKKVVLADYLGGLADKGFGAPEALRAVDAWVATLAYAGQIFCDFSGYCEMALGFALLFGIDLPVNFATPYKASNLADFWRRWHITLGRFFREYVYIPLGGSRAGTPRTLTALLVVSLLSGIWHGAGNQFVLWGFLHGTALCVHRLWTVTGHRMPVALGQALTLGFVVLAWVPFRAADVASTVQMWESLAGLAAVPPTALAVFDLQDLMGLLFFGWLMTELPDPREVTAVLTPMKRVWYTSATLSSVWLLSGTQSFLYFNF